MFDEVSQQLELAGGELERVSGFRDLRLAEVNMDVAKLVASRVSAVCRAAPQLGLDPRKQLDHLEWLRDVVVRAELQAHDLVDNLPSSRQHDYGHVHASSAPLAQDVEPIDVWQHDVEEH